MSKVITPARVGMSLWVMTKADELASAYEVFEATRTEDAALNVTTKLSEIVAGVATGYVAEAAFDAAKKTGLDRVFDSIRKDQGWNEYVKTQGNGRVLTSYLAGEASDGLIEWGRGYVEKTHCLDPAFDVVTDIRSGEFIGNLKMISKVVGDDIRDALSKTGSESSTKSTGTKGVGDGPGNEEVRGMITVVRPDTSGANRSSSEHTRLEPSTDAPASNVDRMQATHPSYPLFLEIQRRLPPGTPDDVTAHVALAAKMGGIGAGEISKFEVHGDRAFLLGRIPGDKAAVDMANVPPLQETLQRSQAFDQQQSVAISAQPAAVQRQDAEAPPPPPRIS